MACMSRTEVIESFLSKIEEKERSGKLKIKGSDPFDPIRIGPFVLSDFDPEFLGAPEVIFPELKEKLSNRSTSLELSADKVFHGMVSDVSYYRLYILISPA